jgi:hypothetical protein
LRTGPVKTLEEALFDTRFVTLLGSPEAAVELVHLAPLSPPAQLSREAMLGPLLFPCYERRQKLVAFNGYAVEYAYQRGVLHLLEGDAAAARQRFAETRTPPVPEWGVPGQTHPTAEFYLGVFREAEVTPRRR